MAKSYINMKLEEFKNKFNNFLLHKKKVKALENLSECMEFKHKNYLPLVKECLNEGFLDPKAEDFLEYMLDQYDMKAKYLVWCHKTKWVKRQQAELGAKSLKKDNQLYINFDKLLQNQPTSNVPVELLAQRQRQSMRSA